jgi:hypothetical protein
LLNQLRSADYGQRKFARAGMELGSDFSRLTLDHGCKCTPDDSMSIEDVLIAISEQVGGLNIKSASRMNRALVIFLKEVVMVDELLEKGLVVNNTFLPVMPLSNPSKKVVISNVPPFIKEGTLKEILERYGKLTAPIKMIPLGLKNPNFKHVMSFRRFTYMIPNSQNEPLNLVLKIAVEGKDYTIFITSDNMRCFLCGEHGHQKQTCPKQQSVNILAGSQTTVQEKNAGVKENNASVQENNAAVQEKNAAGKENNAAVQENNASVHEVIDKVVERKVEINDVNTGDDTVDGPTSANAVGRKNESTEAQKVTSQSKNRDEDLLMEYVETNDKNDDKLEEVVNENCSQSFTAGSSVARSDSDSDECESVGSFLEMGDIDLSQTGTSELSGCETKVYSTKEISAFLDETKGVRNPQFDLFFPDLRRFLVSCRDVMTNATVEEFSRQKRYRLKKIITKVKKMIHQDMKKK